MVLVPLLCYFGNKLDEDDNAKNDAVDKKASSHKAVNPYRRDEK